MTAEVDQSQPRPRWWLGLVGVTIALSAPLVQALVTPWFTTAFGFPMDRLLSLLPFWIAVILVLAIARFGEGYPLSTFGFKRDERTLRARLIEWILAVVMAMVVAYVIFTFSTYVRSLLTDKPAPVLAKILLLPWWVLVPAWPTGFFTEEVLFRGYSIERLTLLTGRRWLAAIITMLAFVFLHLFGWDWIHVLTVVLPGGILMTLLYQWRGLGFVMIIHAIMNAPLLLVPLVAPYM